MNKSSYQLFCEKIIMIFHSRIILTKLSYSVFGCLLLLGIPVMSNNKAHASMGTLGVRNPIKGTENNALTPINNPKIKPTLKKQIAPDLEDFGKKECRNTENNLFIQEMGRSLTEEVAKRMAEIQAQSSMLRFFHSTIETATEKYIRIEMQGKSIEENQILKETIKETKTGSLIGFLVEDFKFTYQKNASGQRVCVCTICCKIPIRTNYDLFIQSLKSKGTLPQDFDFEGFTQSLVNDYKQNLK